MSDTVRIGVIGAGNMGSAHLSCIHEGQVRGLVVSAVCDTDHVRLDAIRRQDPDV